MFVGDKRKNKSSKKGKSIKAESAERIEKEKPQVAYRSYTLGRRLGLR